MGLVSKLSGIRGSFALLLWVLAATPCVFLALNADSPSTAAWAAEAAAEGMQIASRLLILGIVIGLLAYPPFIPGLRLWLRRLKTRMSIDQGPAIAARGRLKHLETADDHVLIARTALDMGSPTGALPHLLRAIEIEAENLGARFYLGRVYRHLGVLPKAIAELLLVVQRDPAYSFGEAAFELATCLDRVGEEQKAFETLQVHRKVAGENRRSLLLEARILNALHDFTGAKEALRRAAREPEPGQRFSLEEARARARARFALWRGGRA